MLLDATQVNATTQRFEDRTKPRERNKRLIEQRLWLKADSPDRVRKFLERRGFEGNEVDRLLEQQTSPEGPTLESSSNENEPYALERIMGTNDLLGVAFLQAGLRVSRTVARVWVRVNNGRPAGY